MSEARGPWLKWAWRYYVLEVEDFDSLGEALSAAYYASEQGQESLHCIEGPSGVIDRDEVERLLGERDAREGALREQRQQEAPRFAIKIKSPAGDDLAWWGTYATEAERDAEAEVLRVRLGDRVVVGTNPWCT